MTDSARSAHIPLRRNAGSAGSANWTKARILHLGVGAFHRAHQAWYTAHASDGPDWGIVGFTGRSRMIADRLSAQGGLYTLVERGPEEDRYETVPSLIRVESGDDVPLFVSYLAEPQIAILTITITEAGYRLAPGGAIDLKDSAVCSDVRILRESIRSASLLASPLPATALGRILLGLEARRRAAAPPIAIVPCDNMPDNGTRLSDALAELARLVSPDLAAWLHIGVSYVSTSVDRITPRVEPADVESVLEATGVGDAAPVVTEPFSDWIISGGFPSGRPAWESAGARFVDDLEPWENRKLWMLNGAHTLLASLGQLRGHRFVAEAIADPICRDAVEALWDEAAPHLVGVDVEQYRQDLIARFLNQRIAHTLEQIALDAEIKTRLRIVPVVLRERASGRDGSAGALAIAALFEWHGVAGDDVPAGLASLDPRLADDEAFCALVRAAMAELPVEPGRQGTR